MKVLLFSRAFAEDEKKGKKEGKAEAEVVAAKPTGRWDKKYGGFAVTPEHFTRIAYAGV